MNKPSYVPVTSTLSERATRAILRKAKDEARYAKISCSTLGRLADQYRATLKVLDVDPESIFYGCGKEAYELYTKTLLKEDSMLEKRDNVKFRPW